MHLKYQQAYELVCAESARFTCALQIAAYKRHNLEMSPAGVQAATDLVRLNRYIAKLLEKTDPTTVEKQGSMQVNIP